MSNKCTCNRSSNYNEEYIVEGFIKNFNSNEEWWDAMSEYQFDGEIVILELRNKIVGYLLDYYKPGVLQGDRVEHPDYIREKKKQLIQKIKNYFSK